MLWNNVKLPFGFINGRFKHIDDVQNGRACGCRCPKCDRPLEARNKGEIRAHYFAHYDADECSGATETAIHQTAKQILYEAKEVLTPLFERSPQQKDEEGKNHYGTPIRIKSKLVKADESHIEIRLEGYIPDVILTIKGKHLLVEIKVTHEVDFDKRSKVEHNNEAMIEIDLSDIDSSMLSEMSKFKHYVIHEAPRYWIHNPRGEDDYKKSELELTNKVKQINISLKERIQKNKKIQQEELDRQEKKKLDRKRNEANKAKHRIIYAEPLEKLASYQTPQWQNQRKIDQQTLLANSADVSKIKNVERTRGICPLIDINVINDWIFNTHKSIWQAEILKSFVFKKKSVKEFNSSQVVELVINKFGILNEVKELYKLKRECEKKWSLSKGYKGGCWFFTEKENQSIPSPFLPIYKYLEYLTELEIIQKVSCYKFHVLTTDFELYIDSAQKVEEERKLQQQKAKIDQQKQQEESERLSKIEEQKQKEERDRLSKEKRARTNQIMASEKRVFMLFGGDARECKKCYLFSHSTDNTVCPFCEHDEFEKIKISAYNIEKAFHRYKCSTHPDSSVERSPSISNTDLFAEWVLDESGL